MKNLYSLPKQDGYIFWVLFFILAFRTFGPDLSPTRMDRVEYQAILKKSIQENESILNDLKATTSLMEYYRTLSSGKIQVIFKKNDTLWKTLGITKEEDALYLAKISGFKYFYNKWGNLIVLVPEGTVFEKSWHPIKLDSLYFKKDLVKI